MARSEVDELCCAVRTALRAAADPGRAPAMQAYMKSTMPFLGVGAPERRALVRDAARRHAPVDASEWLRAVRELWQAARFREERYAACDLVLDRKYSRWLDLEALPLLEEMIVGGAWWDFVDQLASHAVGDLLAEHPTKMGPLMLRWARSDDLWKRRTAILCQLRFGPRTDTALLERCIAANLSDRDFFIRKAIGWALRQYGRTDPKWTRAVVKRLGPSLSPLSRREALLGLEPR